MIDWRALADGFHAVTEKAAMAAAQTMGTGDGEASDRIAIQAMRGALDELDIDGRVVIGEVGRGASGAAPAEDLRVGDEVGREGDGALEVDLAVDPLEGARLCAGGGPGSLSVLAASERGGLLALPDVDMEKIVVGPSARGSVHLDAPVPENLRGIARAFDREVSDLTVVVLDRERHRQLVTDIRDAGSRIRLIPEGDLSAAISAAVRGTGVHAVMGVGGAPEGVLAAAALRCLGGEMQARLVASDAAQRKRLDTLGLDDPSRIYSTEDLARGEHVIFSATGVTSGELLRGVRFFGGGVRASTLAMSMPGRTVRFVETIHLEDTASPVHLY